MNRRDVFPIFSVLLVAACLRPAITSVGPLLGPIGGDTGLSEAWLGLLGAIPLLMFAAFSLLAARTARRWGMEVAVLGALLALVVGIVVRSTSGLAGLWIGTGIAGAAVAIANVLTPALVKRDFIKTTLAMAAFTTVLAGFASIASGTAVPLADWLGGWREGLLAWALLPLVVAGVWIIRIARTRSAAPAIEPEDPKTLKALWRSPVAWQVTVFFGLQSATFYTVVTWLPSIEHSFGVSERTAGLHLLIYQVLGAACGLGIGVLMQRRDDQRFAAVAISLPVAVAMLGLTIAPGAALLWVVVAAAGAGAALTVALALVVLRTSTTAETAALSGMAQAVGYLIGAVGPFSAGLLADSRGWKLVLLSTAGVATVQTVLGLWAGQSTPVRHEIQEEAHVGTR